MNREIRIAESESDIRACHAVMRQLRPAYGVDDFVAQVRRQQRDGYRLALLADGGDVVAVAGYRIGENLAWGRHVYVDDLVTDATRRSAGYGSDLMRWLVSAARHAGCRELHLDSGVQRFAAHRFYLSQRMKISSHHFAMEVESRDG